MFGIRLLGIPQLDRDGRPGRAPRGNKTWALLAYLLLSRRPPGRRRLAELLFNEADDPLGALRWNLAELRRSLGSAGRLRGDPVILELEAGTEVDVLMLQGAELPDPTRLEPLTGELLEGMSFPASPAFEAWLTVERRRAAAALESLLLERGQLELGSGRPDAAARIAASLLSLNPLEEAHHELLIQSLVTAGDTQNALQRARAAEQLLQREIGTAAVPRLQTLVHNARHLHATAEVSSTAMARGQLQAGEAAIRAGAVDAGLQSLRLACAAARRCSDRGLLAAAELALGSALVHSMRAYGEAAVALHEATHAAASVGAAAVSAAAYRELGFVDVQAGRRERAEAWLSKAEALVTGQNADAELASIAAVRGMGLSDAGDYGEALECFDLAVERSLSCGDRRQTAWARALAGRVHVLEQHYQKARRSLRQSLETMSAEGWIAAAPLPEAMLAHADLAEGRTRAAADALEHAFILACQMADPCWEGIACHGIGLLEEARGNAAQALAWLADGRARCTRVAHPYQWVHAWLLDALCACGRHQGDKRTRGWMAQLESLASRTGMRELLLHAYQHRMLAGDTRAGKAAQMLAEETERTMR